MKNVYQNAVVGQSGGPTAAINATLAGVIEGVRLSVGEGKIHTLYGMRNGIEGFLNEELLDLTSIFEDEKKIEVLKHTPSAALGSCRRRLKDFNSEPGVYSKIFDIFKKYSIKYFFYIGGNDSMDTVLKISKYAEAIGYDINVVGIPKTVDNDLMATDHTPGFASAAKFVAITVKEILRDISVYKTKAVTIVEIMGRDAGWLTASSALPKLSGKGPHLIYLPEVAFDEESFYSSIEKAFEKENAILVAVSEGIKFANGEYVGAGGTTDAFGHKQLSGAGRILETLVRKKFGCKVRSVELNLPQRCAAHVLSKTDIEESCAIGTAAVFEALQGKSGIMMTFIRVPQEEYRVEIGTQDISKIANEVRRVPLNYINDERNGVTDECISYIAPLILGEVELEYEFGMPKHIIL